MNILVTGSAGFVGKNLVENLKNIRDGKNRTRPILRLIRFMSMTGKTRWKNWISFVLTVILCLTWQE